MSHRVLVITDLVHAAPRIPGLVKYLPGYGWEPVVVTPRLVPSLDPRVRTILTPHAPVLAALKGLVGVDPHDAVRIQLRDRLGKARGAALFDRLLHLTAHVVNYPDAERRWRPAAVRAVERLAAETEIHAVLTSSSPVTAHLIGRWAKMRYGYPWVADLRDLWSQNHNYGYGEPRRRLDRRLERKTLAQADALVTVSAPWAARLASLHARERVHTITNGYDPANVSSGPGPPPDRFTVLYTGTIYRERQDPGKFLAAVRVLLDAGTLDRTRIDIRFHARDAEWLMEAIQEAGLSRVASVRPVVGYQQALELQRCSHVLLLLNWEDTSELGWYPLKLFEYLAARRPILAVGGGGRDVVSALLRETGAGCSCPDVSTISVYLQTLYREWVRTGRVVWHGRPQAIARYGYPEMAGRFAEVLDEVAGCSRKQPPTCRSRAEAGLSETRP